MNNFEIIKKKNTDDLNDVKITMSPEMAPEFLAMLKEVYPDQIEQGKQETMPDGEIELRFELNDEHAAKFTQALLHAYTKFSGFETPN